MILTRKKNDQFQIYCNADIFDKNGKWLSNGEGGICDLPHIFKFETSAKTVMEEEQKKSPDWDYKISYYE